MSENMKQFLLGSEGWAFIPEIILRTFIMYAVILIGLRVLGKRGVKQLSVFELVVIIGLGSAAGDPMFYKEVGVLNAIIVFSVVVIAYKFTSHLVSTNEKVETLLEGKCTCLIEHGKFTLESFKKESLAQDEFFAELRLKGVSHLGQIKLAILETSGSLSMYYYPDEEVKFGLPVLPALFSHQIIQIKYKDYYSCRFCGNTELISPVDKHSCNCCGKSVWVKSINVLRVT